MNVDLKLKNKLQSIKANNYEASKEEIQVLIPQMLKNIGTIDSELRDKLIYSIFFMWIIEGKLTEDELRQLLKTALSEAYLLYKVGETNSDSIFTRSFSVLIVAVILYYNQNIQFLTDAELLVVYDGLIDYFNKEKDYRGYVKEKGWAHSIAHAADALDEIVKYDVIDQAKLKNILHCIKEKIQIDHYVYVNGEDERLVIAVYSLLKRNVLDLNEIEAWLNSIIDYKKRNIYPEDDYIIMNIKCFLRSLYFRLANDHDFKQLSLLIKSKLDEVDEYKQ